MANRNLNAEELEKARRLLRSIRSRLEKLSEGDKDLLFAYRRKIYKELTYDERSSPMVRKRLKKLKFQEQGGRCAMCNRSLPEKNAVLDRLKAAPGYTSQNTRLICQPCDTKVQASREYA